MLLPLLKNDRERINFFRKLSKHLKLDLSDILIRITRSGFEESDPTAGAEYASTVPKPKPQHKRMYDGSAKENEPYSQRFVCWISLSGIQLSFCLSNREDLKDVPSTIEKVELLEQEEIEAAAQRRGSGQTFAIDQDPAEVQAARLRRKEIARLRKIISIGQRKLDIEQAGDICLPVGEYIMDLDYKYSEKALIFSSESDFFDALGDITKNMAVENGVQFAVSETFYVGDADLAALCFFNPTRTLSSTKRQAPMSNFIVSSEFLASNISQDTFDLGKLALHLGGTQHQFLQDETASLKACGMMADIYKLLPDATISTLVVSQPLSRAKWIPTSSEDLGGTCNLDPTTLTEVFAMSSGNSLYVAGTLLCDPYEQPGPSEIRRVVGNIGRAGITFLISPPEVKIREADPEKWMSINHSPFDGKLENHFKQTSIHLSFTEYAIPLITEDNPRHIIDRAVVLVETLISVYDGGTWVAEVDVLKAFRSPIHRQICGKTRHGHKTSAVMLHKSEMQRADKDGGQESGYEAIKLQNPHLIVTSVENWDELIEAPSIGIIAMRAHKNWLARLAATTICVSHDFKPIVLPEDPCWVCCAELIPRNSNDKFALIC